MEKVQGFTYEKIYYTLWEAAQRYGGFTQFRVIGNSHDERMIPMLEIGQGEGCVFCIGGLSGTDREMADILTCAAMEYCRAYECRWLINDFYDVRKLLDRLRICIIPVLNPDGYEISRNGYGAIRNPIFRQMLKMQDIPKEEFCCNARGTDISLNFPTRNYRKKRIYQEPASENETKAAIRIFQEYTGRGLLFFCGYGKRIVYYAQEDGRISRHIARLAGYMKKYSGGNIKNCVALDEDSEKRRSVGRPEQYYGEFIKQPAFRIELASVDRQEQEIREVMLFPLEYIFSLSE